MDFREYLPKHHMDNYYIEELKALSDEEIKPLLKDLLVWVKNMHLPVSKEVVDVLIKRANLLTEIITELLENERTDSILKYNIIAYLIQKFPKDEITKYEKVLNRIVSKPIKWEIYSEVDLIAKTVLNKI